MRILDRMIADPCVIFFRKHTPFLYAAVKVVIGYREIQRIRKKYGRQVHIFFMRGATGDSYLQFMFFQNWLREHPAESYVMVGDSAGMMGVAPLFSISNCEQVRTYQASSIQKACMLLGCERLHVTMMFPWHYDLYVNRCRVRMTERFQFLDTYRSYVLGLKKGMKALRPVFVKKDRRFYFDMAKRGLAEHQTVIIAPDANSVTQLPMIFWNDLIGRLKKAGYRVFVNCSYCSAYRAPDIFFSYEESVPLLEYCGYFIGVRSGLCDIISTAQCRKIILYPQKAEKVNYSEHRSEKEFSGFEVMGLVKEDENMIEIDTPLIRNITQPEWEQLDMDVCFAQMTRLREQILCGITGRKSEC